MGTAPVFLVDRDQLGADRPRLSGAEGRHAATVRRLRPGEPVVLTDGAGRVAQCRVDFADRSGITCQVERRYDVPAPQPRLTVVQAVPKGDRAQTAVETLTEVGVDVVVPWLAQRSVPRWDAERAARAVERWRATAREATKQARRAWLAEVRGLASTAEVAALLTGAALPVVLHESAERPLQDVEVPATGDIVVVVGPEGGLTEEELETFARTGSEPVHLGPTVLRTSTAGTVAAAVLLSRTRRWAVSAP